MSGSHTSGRSLADVAADLRCETLTPDDLPLTAFRHPETGNLVSMNTRTRAVLAEAGLEPTKVEIIDLNSLSKSQRAKYLTVDRPANHRLAPARLSCPRYTQHETTFDHDTSRRNT